MTYSKIIQNTIVNINSSNLHEYKVIQNDHSQVCDTKTIDQFANDVYDAIALINNNSN